MYVCMYVFFFPGNLKERDTQGGRWIERKGRGRTTKRTLRTTGSGGQWTRRHSTISTTPNNHKHRFNLRTPSPVIRLPPGIPSLRKCHKSQTTMPIQKIDPRTTLFFLCDLQSKFREEMPHTHGLSNQVNQARPSTDSTRSSRRPTNFSD